MKERSWKPSERQVSWFLVLWIIGLFALGMTVNWRRDKMNEPQPNVSNAARPAPAPKRYVQRETGRVYEAWEVNTYDQRNAPAWVWDAYQWADAHGTDLTAKASGKRVVDGSYVVRLTTAEEPPTDRTRKQFWVEFSEEPQ